MFRFGPALVIALVAMLAVGVAQAQHFEDDDDEEQENAFVVWAKDGGNRMTVGLNGILTAPADPVMFAIEGDEVFESLPAPEYTGRAVGFCAGVFQMPYRMGMGTFDVAFFLDDHRHEGRHRGTPRGVVVYRMTVEERIVYCSGPAKSKGRERGRGDERRSRPQGSRPGLHLPS